VTVTASLRPPSLQTGRPVARSSPAAPTAPASLIDRTRTLLLIHLIDDIADALELWQSAGSTDSTWVVEYWSRRVVPWLGVELPAAVREAPDAWELHRTLLAWQVELAEQLGESARTL